MKYSEEFKKTPEYQRILNSNQKWYEANKEKRKIQMRTYWNNKNPKNQKTISIDQTTAKLKPNKKMPYLQRENIDTTFSSIWMFRKNNSLNNQFDNIVLKDPIGNIKKMNTVRTVNGINYYSKFNPIIADNIISYWSNKGDIILDPFSGRTRAIISAAKERIYYGFEIAKSVYDIASDSIKTNTPFLKKIPTLYNDDSFNIDDFKYDHITADLIFTCPPYFNIEKYPSTDGQLSDIKEYQKFLDRLKNIMKKSCNRLKKGGYAILVVGDFRIKSKLICFHNDIINLMKDINIPLHDIIISQTVTHDRAAHRFGSCKNTKITAKIHEFILVFKK
jgi:DNA modification methylase